MGVTKELWLWAIWRCLRSARAPQHVESVPGCVRPGAHVRAHACLQVGLIVCALVSPCKVLTLISKNKKGCVNKHKIQRGDNLPIIFHLGMLIVRHVEMEIWRGKTINDECEGLTAWIPIFSSSGLSYHKQRVQSVSASVAHGCQMKRRASIFPFSLLRLTGGRFSVSTCVMGSFVCSSIDLSWDALTRPL